MYIVQREYTKFYTSRLGSWLYVQYMYRLETATWDGTVQYMYRLETATWDGTPIESFQFFGRSC